MNRILSLTIVLLVNIFITTARSQSSYSVTSKLVDSLSTSSIGYASIYIKSEKVSKKILTSDDGTLNINLEQGKYIFTFSAYGYLQKKIEVFIENRQIDLGTIKLEQTSKKLNEVLILGSRPIIKKEIDRLVYDVQADEDHKNTVMLDMMRKVPLIAINADEKITIQGKSNFRIMVNGKPSVLLSNKPADVLRTMASSGVDKIEVITVPPSKYESEGLAGIINIVTVKKQGDGYGGNVNLGSNFLSAYKRRSLGGAFNFKKDKFNLSISAGATDDRPKEDVDYMRNGKIDQSSLTQIKNNRFKSPYAYASTEMSLQLDSLNLISGELNFYRSSNDVTFHTISNFDQPGSARQSFTNSTLMDEIFDIATVGLNYEKSFKRNSNQLLSLAYRYSRQSDNINSDIVFSNLFNAPTYNNFTQFNDQKALEHTLQVDFSYPIKKVIMEAGAKLILRNNNSRYQYVEDGVTSFSNGFENDQNVSSAYNSYSFDLGKWKFKTGARLEHTRISKNLNGISDRTEFNFLNLSPSIAIQRPLTNNRSLNFGYTQRISRPSINDLNTFVDQSNPLVQRTGNPSLEPSVGNNFQFSFSRYDKSIIDIGLNYSFQNNMIQRIRTFDPNTNITLIRYDNIAKDRALGANFYFRKTFAKKVTATANGSLSYVWISGLVGENLLENEGLFQYYNLALSYTIKKGLRLNSNFDFQKPRVTLQSKIGSNFGSTITINKDFMDRKITAGLSAINLFAKHRNFSTVTQGDNFNEYSNTQVYYRVFSAKVSYRFGQVKGEMRKAKKTIQNNDLNN
ncbi:outer membrane beta-barrel family protein [Pedobacter xixiisoli]|uniref:Outer membrane receptor proteins, mostly Fe transport n=1 Tax=Pedobacter xixiisoli TaxID=1476464 RepID=A0A285ZS02_9SPHI|nr:outer membrane beta-barrel family protein [Pedobacter xixiisoli]SOD12429.1 Outer membrane receptor proteins, mostly Fe transport [Pedobacter xixiisoli]